MRKTLSFSEATIGWTSFWSYHPDFIFSLKGEYYTVKDNAIWRHYDESTPENRGYFYGDYYDSTIQLVLNDGVSTPKNFTTVNYEGTNGWEVSSFISDEYYPNTATATPISITDTTAMIKSYSEGKYTYRGVTYWSGFRKKENKYFANLKNNSVILREGEVISGQKMTGIKGAFGVVSLSTDSTTDVGGRKQLFAVSSEFSVSSN